jgi:NAD(P)H-nitrite reductase large subunit
MIRQMPVLSTYRSKDYISRNNNKKDYITIFKREMENLQQLSKTLDRMNIPTYKSQLEEHILKTYHLLEYLLKNFSISKKRKETRQAKLIAARQSMVENA